MVWRVRAMADVEIKTEKENHFLERKEI